MTLVCTVLTLIAMTPLDWGRLFERGSSSRLMIWNQAVDLIKEKPVFGHGIASKFYYKNEIGDYNSHPHSIYLGTLVQLGGFGLSLLLSLGLYAFYLCVKGVTGNRKYILIAWLTAGGVFGLTDMNGYYVNLSLEWLMSWLLIPAIALATNTENCKAYHKQ